ncbi:MAG: ABC transporter substrate-binding protein [Actinobacteria bacterium]|nr:MAG: ABC transporter substrate-binding protein [Actinomycetota bacterium]
MGRFQLGSRSPDPGGLGPAPDGSDLRRRRRALGTGDRPLRAARRAGAKDRLVGPEGGRGLRTATLALVVAVAALAAGCGEKSEDVSPGNPQPFDVALDFYVNADHAGLYEAIDRGYFRDAGLDVHPQVPSDPSAPIKEVAAGRVDLAISYEPEVLLAHDQGLPVKAVAAVVPTPLTSLIWLKGSGIRDVKDLRGKTIATAGIPYQAAYLQTILERSGLSTHDVNVVNVQQGLLPAILSGRADAMLGGFLNVEGVDLRLRGKVPTVIPVGRLGIPTYDELVLVANSDHLNDETQNVRLFIAALERGTKAAVTDPTSATKAVLNAGKGLSPKFTAAEVRKTLPLLLPRAGKRPYGYMDPRQWQRFAQFFADHGLIKALPSTGDVLTNDLLPGKIP